MIRFMWAVRRAYNTKRIAFVIAFFAVAVFLYFAPYHLFSAVRPESMFGEMRLWVEMNAGYAAGYIDASTLNAIKLSMLPFAVSSLVLFVITAALVFFDLKWKPCIAASAVFSAYAIARASTVFSAYAIARTSVDITIPAHAELAYFAFYIIVCLLVIVAVALILLAAYLPLKEPAPRPERPKRERKPTKAERIAELERQVAALRGKEKDET